MSANAVRIYEVNDPFGEGVAAYIEREGLSVRVVIIFDPPEDVVDAAYLGMTPDLAREMGAALVLAADEAEAEHE